MVHLCCLKNNPLEHPSTTCLACSLPAWEKFTTKLSCTCPALYLPGKNSPQNSLVLALLYLAGKNSPQNCLVLALLSTCLGKIQHKIVLHLPCSLPGWEKFTTKLPYICPALYLPWEIFTTKLPCTCPVLYLPGKNAPQNCPALYLPGKNAPQNCLVLVTGHHHSIKVTQDFQD